MKEVDHNTAVRSIVRFLKGPVADVYRGLVPQFGDISGEEFYELVLSRSDMLHGCVAIFHKHREAFDHLTRDNKGRIVRDDFVPMKCGRSVHDIIAMILRTHAKKQFREQLGGDPSDPRSASGRLYAAIREYLMHDWQINLVPHYADLPAHLVEEMGPALLELTDVQQVIALGKPSQTAPKSANGNVRSPANTPAPPPAPAATSKTGRDGDEWWEPLNDEQIRALFAPLSEMDRREWAAAFGGISLFTRQYLLDEFKLSKLQSTALLGACYRSLGRAQFSQHLCGISADSAVRTLAVRLQAVGLNERMDLSAIVKASETGISNALRTAAFARPSQVA